MNPSRLAKTILGTTLSCAILLGSPAVAADAGQDAAGSASVAATTGSTDAAGSASNAGTTAEPGAKSSTGAPEESAAKAAGKDAVSTCKIECDELMAACSESHKLIEILMLLADAYARGDLVTYEAYLDDGCTTFDEGTKKLIVGKQAVVEHLKRRFQEFSPNGKTPLLWYKIQQPYAKVTGDTAVVTFVAETKIGGKSPYRAENHVTDIFVKHGDQWKKLHYRGRWRKVG